MSGSRSRAGSSPRLRRVGVGRSPAGPPPAVWRRRLIAIAVLAALLLGGYWFWLRDSSLVAVEEVEVKGATANAAELSAALEGVALEMTTLHVEDDKLVEAVSSFPTVASIAADATVPHKLTITVIERLPIAVVKVEGEPVAVSSDGFLLPGIGVEGKRLPTLDAAAVSGGRLDAEGSAQAAIVGAVPEELRERIDGVAWDPSRGGVVVELEGAPEARFGDGDDSEAKWAALAAVLLDPEASGSGYVDVSVPERAVTGA